MQQKIAGVYIFQKSPPPSYPLKYYNTNFPLTIRLQKWNLYDLKLVGILLRPALKRLEPLTRNMSVDIGKS